MKQLYFFHAPWCPPCRFFEKQFVSPLASMVGPNKIVRIDVQKEPFRADRYGVSRVPMAILMEGGKAVDYVGMADLDRCAQFLKGE